ncbi:hypothetical protein GWI33_002744 [Rhynchophorus ferrugineus]|uniref:FLYWCH-type domain-containing protein n=1 Tax=Rhynchophorus ferrugineus TaxID=354439 RepID=A0A834IMM2_RHYFE|nr:hypothetical protein GWI33_002744 [Rhynchophorus ferrugineus]
MSSVYFDVGNKNPKIILDEQSYRVFKKFENKTVWLCSQYFGTRTDRCKSKLTTTGRTIIVSADPHNHAIIPKRDKYYQNMQCQNVTIIREGQNNCQS